MMIMIMTMKMCVPYDNDHEKDDDDDEDDDEEDDDEKDDDEQCVYLMIMMGSADCKISLNASAQDEED